MYLKNQIFILILHSMQLSIILHFNILLNSSRNYKLKITSDKLSKGEIFNLF